MTALVPTSSCRYRGSEALALNQIFCWRAKIRTAWQIHCSILVFERCWYDTQVVPESHHRLVLPRHHDLDLRESLPGLISYWDCEKCEWLTYSTVKDFALTQMENCFGGEGAKSALFGCSWTRTWWRAKCALGYATHCVYLDLVRA